MFLGMYNHICDGKNRLRIPPKFKRQFEKEFYVCKGSDSCLFIFPKEDFEEILSKLSSLPMFDSKVQKPLRLIFSSASKVKQDSQGRFLLENNLKAFAKVKKDVVFVGVGKRLELWAKEVWEEYLKSNNKNFDEILGELGKYEV